MKVPQMALLFSSYIILYQTERPNSTQRAQMRSLNKIRVIWHLRPVIILMNMIINKTQGQPVKTHYSKTALQKQSGQLANKQQVCMQCSKKEKTTPKAVFCPVRQCTCVRCDCGVALLQQAHFDDSIDCNIEKQTHTPQLSTHKYQKWALKTSNSYFFLATNIYPDHLPTDRKIRAFCIRKPNSPTTQSDLTYY